MRRSVARAVCAGLLFAVAGHGRPAVGQAPDVRYAVRYLESLGGSNSRGNSINDRGWIAGYSNLEGDRYRHATLWAGDEAIDLGALGSPTKPKNSNVAWPVKNTRGRLVGISQTDSPDPFGERWSCWPFFPAATSTGYRCVGFVWESGRMRPLPTLGGTHGYAAAANDAGQIVGWAENRVRDATCEPPQVFQFRAVVWGPHGNQVRELPVWPGDSSSAATAINGKGQVVGISGKCDQAVGRATAERAVLWEGDSIEDIGNLGGGLWNTPTAINERGDIVGFSNRAGEAITEAFLWTREGGIVGLGMLPLPGHVYSEAHAINESRQVVGLSCTEAFSCRAFLWENGVMTDLNDLVPLPPGEMLTHGMDISNAGVITGRAIARGGLVAYEAFPLTNAAALRRTATVRSHQRAAADDAALSPERARAVLSPFGPGRARLDAETEKR